MPDHPQASILIVDDEAAQMQALCDTLRGTGYNTRGFTRPEAALESIKERSAELETANRDLDAFAHSVSHDLRAPLRGVNGLAGILEEDFGEGLGADGCRLIRAIRTDCGRMEQLIDDLLAFSRLGRQPLKSRPVPLNELVNEILLELRPACEGRTIQFSVGELRTAQADPSLLRQALLNLLSNAIKFTGKTEQPSVQVGRLPDRAAGGRVYFVKDNGAGFDMRHAQKLFGVFERLHRQAEYEGTGVGLAIVQRIVQRHGGRVWAEGVVDGGATFYFSLPAE